MSDLLKNKLRSKWDKEETLKKYLENTHPQLLSFISRNIETFLAT
jgi:hypothetical protein